MYVKVNGELTDVKKTSLDRVDGSLGELKKFQAECHSNGTTASLCGGTVGGYWLTVRKLK